MSKLLEE
jgi:chromosome segregation ATPase